MVFFLQWVINVMQLEADYIMIQYIIHNLETSDEILGILAVRKCPQV